MTCVTCVVFAFFKRQGAGFSSRVSDWSSFTLSSTAWIRRYRFSVTDSDSVAESNLSSAVEAILRTDEADRTLAQENRLFRAWQSTVPEFAIDNAKIEELWQTFPETDSQLVVKGRWKPRPTYVFKRGDFLNPGEQVTPAAPAFLNAFPESNEPARLRLARWLVSDDSPTTARAIVNRIW